MYKGEGLPSPFFLFIVLMSNCFAQLGIEGWLHPDPNFLTIKDSSSYIHIYNDTHIGIINFNDSLTITDNKRGIKYIKRFDHGEVRVNYTQYHSITEFIEQDYSAGFRNNYSKTSFGYKLKIDPIAADLDIAKYSKINELSPSLMLSANLRPGLIIRLGKSIQKTPFQFSINYTDFLYRLNDIYTDHEKFQYGINLSGKNYNIDYMMEEDYWIINPTDSSLSKIDLVYGNNKTISLSGYLSLSNNQKINWSYTTMNSYSKLKLLDNSNLRFFELNN